MPKRILVAYDGTPQSEKALAFAIDEWGDQDLTLLNVINPVDARDRLGAGAPGAAEEWYEQAKADAHEMLAAVVDEHDRNIATRIEVGKPATTIVEVTSDDETPFDHLVIGSHGRKGVSRMLLGSVAEKVIRESSVPVTVVR